MKEDENLGVNTRPASSRQRERIVLATFFPRVFFICDSREEKHIEREREEKMRAV